MRALPLTALALLAFAPAARSAAPSIDGEYESPLGRVRVVSNGASFRGVLVVASDLCAFKEGDEVLRATLLDDSLAGQVRVCLAGKGCGSKEEWSSAVLLASGERLSGAVHVAAKGCKAPLGKNGGVAFVRVASTAPTAAPPVPTPTASPRPTSPVHPERSAAAGSGHPERSAAAGGAESKGAKSKGAAEAKELLRDGAAWLREGNFEAARRRFIQATELDPAVPEAYNGVGVTFRMRNDLVHALEWYKKALAMDPDFGDAYYNMACVYALEGQKEMALRYLQIAALNGYATSEGMDGDPDLESVRGEAGYRALVKAKM